MFIGREKTADEKKTIDGRTDSIFEENESQAFVAGEKEEEISPADLEIEEGKRDKSADEELVVTPRKYWEFPFLIGLGIFLLVAILISGYFLVRNFWEGGEKRISISNMPPVTEGKNDNPPAVVEESAEEQPEPEVQKADPKEVSIKVLNGGSAAGSAGKVRDALLAKGYKKVEAANADGNYMGTTVFYSGENNKEAAEKVAADLKTNYPAVKTKAAANAEEKGAPVVVILGK